MINVGPCICQALGIWRVVGGATKGATTEPENSPMNFKPQYKNDSGNGQILGIFLFKRMKNEEEDTSV